MFGLAQLMMWKTEIVTASDQIHAGLQCEQATSGMTGFARQAGQPFPERSIQALDKSGVQDAATMGEQQQCLRLGHQPVGHLTRDLDHPLFLGPLDHGANVQLWPDLQAGSSNSTGLLDLLAEGSADAARIRVPAVRQHQQRSQRCRASADLLKQAVSQAAITRKLDRPCHPQARRNHHGQSHPGNHSASFHSNFVRLNMHQVKLPLLKHLLMNLVTMCSCSISPIGHGSFIQPEGMHNGLDRASIRHEGHHDHDQLHWLAQPLKHRSPTRVEGLFADLTAIALPFAIMDDDGALFSLASCRTHRIRAKYFRRVHRLCCVFLHRHILPMDSDFFKSPSLSPLSGALPFFPYRPSIR